MAYFGGRFLNTNINSVGQSLRANNNAIDELASNYFSYSETIPLFKAVMAYDNDWAYNFIEDMFIFITVAAKHESSFSECLYRAFKEETERQRFKPLIEKFGKNHLYVKD